MTADKLFPGLPAELIGVDCTPEELPKLHNDCCMARERIIITFDHEQAQELADFLGLPTVDTTRKVTYEFNDLKENRKYGLL